MQCAKEIAWILKDIKFICDIFVLFCMYLCYFFFVTYIYIYIYIYLKLIVIFS